jgi:hypothetical protein
MDGIITPASPWTAPRLGITQKLFSVNYTGVWNLLGEFVQSGHGKTFANSVQITQFVHSQ